MSDPLLSERALSFYTPRMHSSAESLTKFVVDRPTVSKASWALAEQFTINLTNNGQSSFIDPNHSFFCCTVRVQSTTADTSNVIQFPVDGQDDGVFLADMPQVKFGVPFFDSVSVNIPGVDSSAMSLLKRRGQSQYFAASRLLCSAASDAYMKSGAAGTFGATGGLLQMSGCSDSYTRMQAVDGTINFQRGTAGAVVPITARSAGLNYCVPLSLFCSLFNKASGLLPLSYLSNGSDQMSFTFQMASVLDDFFHDKGMLTKDVKVELIDPRIITSRVEVYDVQQLSAIQKMYRGLASVPLGDNLSVSVPMVYKYIGFREAPSPLLPYGTGSFSITIPADFPSVRGLMLRFATNGQVKTGVDYLTSDEVVLQSLQISLGSQQYPGKPTKSIELLSHSVSAVDPGRVQSRTDWSELYANYHRGRSAFDPLDTAGYASGVMAPWFSTGSGSSSTQSMTSILHRTGQPMENKADEANRGTPNLFVFDLETFAEDIRYSSEEDAHAARGLDLRGVSSITVSGQFAQLTRAQGVTRPVPSDSNPRSCQVYATIATDEYIRISPGRVDTLYIYGIAPSA